MTCNCGGYVLMHIKRLYGRAAPARLDANDETFGGFFTAGAFSRDDVLAFRRKMREDFERWGRWYKRQTNRPRRPLHCFMMVQETPV